MAAMEGVAIVEQARREPMQRRRERGVRPSENRLWADLECAAVF
jgi:hypothetical protein